MQPEMRVTDARVEMEPVEMEMEPVEMEPVETAPAATEPTATEPAATLSAEAEPAAAAAGTAPPLQTETPEEAARRKKAAKNKAKRERQKAKAKAALQQVRAAEAAGVSVAAAAAAAAAAPLAAPPPPLAPQAGAGEVSMTPRDEVSIDATRAAADVVMARTRDVMQSSGAGVSDIVAQTAATGSGVEKLLRRVEMLAEKQAANREELAARHQLGGQSLQPSQPSQPPQPPAKRLEDMKGDELGQALHKRAAVFATNDRWEDAATAWGQATEVTPDSAEMWYYRGIASQKLERALDAEKYWKRATKLGHKQSAGLLSGVKSKRAQEARVKADALLQADKFDKAIGMYTAAMNICPDNAEHCAACYNGRATALGLTAQWDDAKAAWASASELDPTNPAFLHYQGLASLKLEQFDEAEGFLTKSVDMGHERSRDQLATCHRLQRERAATLVYQKATKLWEEADKNFDSGNGGGFKGSAASAGKSRTSKLVKAALAEFREAAKAGYHNEAGIHIMCTLCLTKLQRWSEAVREIKQALAKIPADRDGKREGGEEGGGEPQPEWSFQGLDRGRLVGMAVNLEKMNQAQERSAAHTLLQSKAG
jgi:tetratricopeptide (TPR) repeat protein